MRALLSLAIFATLHVGYAPATDAADFHTGGFCQPPEEWATDIAHLEARLRWTFAHANRRYEELGHDNNGIDLIEVQPERLQDCDSTLLFSNNPEVPEQDRRAALANVLFEHLFTAEGAYGEHIDVANRRKLANQFAAEWLLRQPYGVSLARVMRLPRGFTDTLMETPTLAFVFDDSRVPVYLAQSYNMD